MIDRVLASGIAGQQSYYFQLIPIGLSIINRESEVPSKGTTYRFLILKGQQKFDETKAPIEAKFEQTNGDLPVMAFNNSRLNFYLPTYTRGRKQDFTLRLIQHQHNQDYEIGDYIIDANGLIAEFKEKNTVRHQLKTTFSEDYELDFEIYVEKSRMAVQKNVKELKQERASKSPLVRARNQSPQKIKEQTKVQEDQTPSRDNQAPKTEEPAQKTPTPVPARESRNKTPAGSEKREPIPSNRSEKNDIASVKSSEKKVPLIETKYRAVSKTDGVAEIHMAESQRLTSGDVPEAHHVSSNGDPTDIKQKLALWGFLVISAIIMYIAMHPNSKV